MNHIVGLSGGKDSTALALRLQELHPEIPFKFICTPTGDELPEMVQHWKNLEKLLGSKLIRVTRRHTDGSTMTLDSLIKMFNALPNWRQRWCTRMLKIEPTIAYIKAHQPAKLYVGLRADEEERKGIYSEDVDSVFPMKDGCCEKHGPWNWGLGEVWSYLKSKNITIPIRTDCAKCYYQRISQWKYLRRHYPKLFAAAVELERITGKTFRSPSKDQWPAALKDLAKIFDSDIRMRSRLPKREEQTCRVCQL